MNTKIPPPPPLRRLRRRSLSTVLALAVGTAGPLPAAEWHLRQSQTGADNWHTLAHWNSAADGSGTAPSSISPSDVYRINKYTLRTPGGTGPAVFGGGVLAMTGNPTVLKLATAGSGGAVVPVLESTGGNIDNAYGSTAWLHVGDFRALSGTTEVHSNVSGRTTKLVIGALSGAGDIRPYGVGSTVTFSIADAAQYTGNLRLTSGALKFDSSVSSSGAFVIEGGTVNLDRAVTFTALTIAGTEYPVDNYSFAELQAVHPGIFTSGTTDGAIVVRAPAAWYLSAGQTSGDWTNIAQWNAASSGTGAPAVSVNPHDNYINNVSGRVLRTPASAATFTGGSLVIANGARLELRAPSGQASTVPALATSAGATIHGAVSGVAQVLAADEWSVDSGTTNLTAAGGSVELRVKRLAGAGNLTVAGGATLRPRIDHANRFTGTLTIATGAGLIVDQTLGTTGPLVVNSGASVTLNDWVYVTALTVAGSAKPLGTHTAASLGFGGSGKVVVYDGQLAYEPQMFGVNLAGAEFDYPFWQTNPSVWDYYNNKGLTLIRLPVKWSRIQSSLHGAVNLDELDDCIDLAAARGMKVIIDLHNYAGYASGPNPPRVGSTGLPISAMVDVWERIATHYKDHPAVYAYDLMNEPIVPDIAVWADALQQTVDAVRRIDTRHFIFIEGLGASNANNWRIGSQNGTLDIKDPVGRLVYSAHSYWDYKESTLPNGLPNRGSDGIYISTDVPTPDIGVNHVAPFIEWLKTRPEAYGNIGEYAVPHDHHSADWNTAMGNFLAHLRANNLSATYWAGGANWTHPDPIICEPHPSVNGGGDKPQMAVLQQYNNIPPAAEVVVDNSDGGGVVVFSPNSTTSTWGSSSATPGYIGGNYRHDHNADKGTKTVTYIPTLTAGGLYEVFVRWTADPNRASNVPVSVNTIHGAVSADPLNQREDGGVWNSIGVYEFAAGASGSVTLSNAGTNGYVIADAVKFKPVGPAVIVDNAGVTGVSKSSGWGVSSVSPGYYGADYLHDGNSGKGSKWVTFNPWLSAAGNYEVSIRWAADPNRATNVPVDVHTATGTVPAEPQDQTANGGQWNPIGVYAFPAGNLGGVTISNTGTTKHVIVDAVKFTPAGGF